MRTFGIAVLVFICLVVLIPLGSALNWFGRATEVAQKEFDPATMLERYNSFKDMSAQLDNKLASIKVLERRTKSLDATYKGKSRADWPREDREQYNTWLSEVAGVKASFNELAARYNADMAKFQYRFTNKGMLPEGATQTLPREYKPYVEE